MSNEQPHISNIITKPQHLYFRIQKILKSDGMQTWEILEDYLLGLYNCNIYIVTIRSVPLILNNFKYI